MSLAGALGRMAGMASTVGLGTRALLPKAPRTVPKATRSINTSAARAQEQAPKQSKGGSRGGSATAPARISSQQGNTLQHGGGLGAPGVLAPFSDFGAVAPTFGRVGGFLRSIEQEMDQMLQALATGNLDQVPAEFRDVLVPLNVDIKDTDKEIVIKADTPGMDGADIAVVLDPDTGVLTISGEREVDELAPDDATGADIDVSAAAGDAAGAKSDVRTRDRGYTRVERKIGQFIRRFKLPDNIDADNIQAKVTNGVLEIHIPKTESDEEPKERKIDVQ